MKHTISAIVLVAFVLGAPVVVALAAVAADDTPAALQFISDMPQYEYQGAEEFWSAPLPDDAPQ